MQKKSLENSILLIVKIVHIEKNICITFLFNGIEFLYKLVKLFLFKLLFSSYNTFLLFEKDHLAFM